MFRYLMGSCVLRLSVNFKGITQYLIVKKYLEYLSKLSVIIQVTVKVGMGYCRRKQTAGWGGGEVEDQTSLFEKLLVYWQCFLN